MAKDDDPETEVVSAGAEESDEETRFERRPFMKLAGATAAGASLAGCTGGGGGGTPEGGETVAVGGGGGGTGEGTGTASAISGVSWKFIDGQALHSPRAKRTMKKLANQYSNDTGSNVNLTIGPGPWDKKFTVLYKNEKYPVAWTPSIKSPGPTFTLQFKNDLVYHWSDMQGRIDEDLLPALEWAYDGDKSPMKTGFRGWINEGYTENGLGAPCGNLFFSSYWLGNKDHFEEVGLDVEEDFPPKDYEHLWEIGETLKDAPSTTAVQFPGSGDLGDCTVPPQTTNHGGVDGQIYPADDWGKTQLNNKTWKEVADLYVRTYTEKGLGSPESPTIDDESCTVLVAKGDISLANVEPLTIPLIKDQNPEMIENQIAMWGPNYMPHGEGDDWQPGVTNPYIFELGKKQPKADAAKWEKKEKAAMVFYNDYLMSENFQSFNYPNDFGIVPMRQDVFDPILERMDEEYPLHMIASVVKQVKASSFAWPAHPAGDPGDQVTAQLETALKGDQSPSEALDKAAAAYQKVLDDSLFGSA